MVLPLNCGVYPLNMTAYKTLPWCPAQPRYKAFKLHTSTFIFYINLDLHMSAMPISTDVVSYVRAQSCGHFHLNVFCVSLCYASS